MAYSMERVSEEEVKTLLNEYERAHDAWLWRVRDIVTPLWDEGGRLEEIKRLYRVALNGPNTRHSMNIWKLIEELFVHINWDTVPSEFGLTSENIRVLSFGTGYWGHIDDLRVLFEALPFISEEEFLVWTRARGFNFQRRNEK